MTADPARQTAPKLSAWVKGLDNDVLAGDLAQIAAQNPVAKTCLTKWIAGWDLLAHPARSDTALSDACLGEYIEPIDAHIQTSKNHVKHSMNGALIAMGIRNPKLQRQAIAAAKRIGRVDGDHGPTSWQTPDAVAYIERAVQHRQRKGK